MANKDFNKIPRIFGDLSQEIVGKDETKTTTLNVTPSTTAATYNPQECYVGFDTVNVSAVDSSIDSNITAENIKKDVEILGVTGEYEAPEVPDYTGPYTVTENGTIAINGKKATEDITVEVPSVQPVLVEANVTSIYGNSQTIRPEEGVDGFSQINLTGLSDPNLKNYNVKKGVTILGVTGTLEAKESNTTNIKTIYERFRTAHLDHDKLMAFVKKYNLMCDDETSYDYGEPACNFSMGMVGVSYSQEAVFYKYCNILSGEGGSGTIKWNFLNSDDIYPSDFVDKEYMESNFGQGYLEFMNSSDYFDPYSDFNPDFKLVIGKSDSSENIQITPEEFYGLFKYN